MSFASHEHSRGDVFFCFVRQRFVLSRATRGARSRLCVATPADGSRNGLHCLFASVCVHWRVGRAWRAAWRIVGVWRPFLVLARKRNQPQRAAAEAILNQFSGNAKAWTRVDRILTQSNDAEAKFFAIQVLNDLIKTRFVILLSSAHARGTFATTASSCDARVACDLSLSLSLSRLLACAQMEGVATRAVRRHQELCRQLHHCGVVGRRIARSELSVVFPAARLNVCVRVSVGITIAQANKLVLTKLNKTLVDIIKQDWPRHWQVCALVVISIYIFLKKYIYDVCFSNWCAGLHRDS